MKIIGRRFSVENIGAADIFAKIAVVDVAEGKPVDRTEEGVLARLPAHDIVQFPLTEAGTVYEIEVDDDLAPALRFSPQIILKEPAP